MVAPKMGTRSATPRSQSPSSIKLIFWIEWGQVSIACSLLVIVHQLTVTNQQKSQVSPSVEMLSTKPPGGLCATSWSVQLPPSSQGCCHSNGNLWSANDCSSWNHHLKLPPKNALMLKPYRRNKVGLSGQFFALHSNTNNTGYWSLGRGCWEMTGVC